jgi:hypothetical protein
VAEFPGGSEFVDTNLGEAGLGTGPAVRAVDMLPVCYRLLECCHTDCCCTGMWTGMAHCVDRTELDWIGLDWTAAKELIVFIVLCVHPFSVTTNQSCNTYLCKKGKPMFIDKITNITNTLTIQFIRKLWENKFSIGFSQSVFIGHLFAFTMNVIY